MEASATSKHREEISSHPRRQPAWSRIILLIVLGFEAVSAMFGGVVLVAFPNGSILNMPVEIMHGAFDDFLIPGMILLGLALLGSSAFIAVFFRRVSADWFFAGMALGGFSIWFIVEIIILRELHWMHLMWGLPVLLGWVTAVPLIVSRHSSLTSQSN